MNTVLVVLAILIGFTLFLLLGVGVALLSLHSYRLHLTIQHEKQQRHAEYVRELHSKQDVLSAFDGEDYGYDE